MIDSRAQGGDKFPLQNLLSYWQYLSGRELARCLCVSSRWHREIPLATRVLDFRDVPIDRIRQLSRLFQGLIEVNFEFMQELVPENLEDLPRTIKRLNLNGCQQIDDAAVTRVCKSCTDIEQIQLYWNMRITDASLKAIGSLHKTLRYLNLSGCQNITDRGLESLGWCQLIELNLTRMPMITHRGVRKALYSSPETLEDLNLYASAGVTQIPSLDHFAKLRKIDLCGSKIGDEQLLKLGKCTQLECVNLTWCINITDTGVSGLASTKIHYLSLFGLTNLTDKCLDALSELKLRALDVNGCTNIQKRTKEELLEKFPLITTFVIHT